MLESSYKICRHCHQDINCATPHKRSQIPALASVQCRAVAAEQNLINLPSDETEPIFHFHLLATLLLQTPGAGHRDTQPAPATTLQYIRSRVKLDSTIFKFSSKSFGIFHCPLHWCGMWRLHRGCWPCLYDHYNHRNGPICNFPDIGTVMFADGGAATWCNNHQ